MASCVPQYMHEDFGDVQFIILRPSVGVADHRIQFKLSRSDRSNMFSLQRFITVLVLSMSIFNTIISGTRTKSSCSKKVKGHKTLATHRVCQDTSGCKSVIYHETKLFCDSNLSLLCCIHPPVDNLVKKSECSAGGWREEQGQAKNQSSRGLIQQTNKGIDEQGSFRKKRPPTTKMLLLGQAEHQPPPYKSIFSGRGHGARPKCLSTRPPKKGEGRDWPKHLLRISCLQYSDKFLWNDLVDCEDHETKLSCDNSSGVLCCIHPPMGKTIKQSECFGMYTYSLKNQFGKKNDSP
ncbi:hypothetical protein H4Q26_014777 [Puccinia striiformis f. sp. tritici PST-130]|nr:hypothetical protein H4Q26_014777 [Puccinia striiformis f. sp. tritici PST-130]